MSPPTAANARENIRGTLPPAREKKMLTARKTSVCSATRKRPTKLCAPKKDACHVAATHERTHGAIRRAPLYMRLPGNAAAPATHGYAARERANACRVPAIHGARHPLRQGEARTLIRERERYIIVRAEASRESPRHYAMLRCARARRR